MPCRKEIKMTSKIVDYKYSPYESNEQRDVGHSSELVDTLRSLMEELRSCKTDNDKIMQVQEKQAEVNEIPLQSLSELQGHGPLRIS